MYVHIHITYICIYMYNCLRMACRAPSGRGPRAPVQLLISVIMCKLITDKLYVQCKVTVVAYNLA